MLNYYYMFFVARYLCYLELVYVHNLVKGLFFDFLSSILLV